MEHSRSTHPIHTQHDRCNEMVYIREVNMAGAPSHKVILRILGVLPGAVRPHIIGVKEGIVGAALLVGLPRLLLLLLLEGPVVDGLPLSATDGMVTGFSLFAEIGIELLLGLVEAVDDVVLLLLHVASLDLGGCRC
jgi:hypothetical protein